MIIDYTLHTVFWLLMFLTPSEPTQWTLEGPSGEPLSIERTSNGFLLHPPEGITEDPVAITVQKTKVSIDTEELDMSTFFSITDPVGLSELNNFMCKEELVENCFKSITIEAEQITLTYIHPKINEMVFSFTLKKP